MLSLFQKDKIAKAQDRTTPADTAAALLGLFEDAEAQRVKFEITLPEGSTGLKRLVAQIEHVRPRSLRLRASSLKGVKESWIGSAVDVFFGIRDRETRHQDFYGFASHIQDAKVSPQGDVWLDLQLPDELESRQRRKNVRVRPYPRRMKAFSLWDYLDPSWPASPPLVGIMDFAKALVRFVDISAGGLRLEYAPAKVAVLPVDPLPGDRFVINMELLPVEGAEKVAVWLVGRASYVASDGKGGLVLGISFVEQGVRDPMTGQIDWRPVTDDTCQEIGAVTYQWSLEAYRKGLTGD